MKQNDILSKFPKDLPALSIQKANYPFFEVKFEEYSFIIPHIGNKNTYGVYRNKKLALISICRVSKSARVHSEKGVQICRDTYSIPKEQFYKNECIWFVQLTDEYHRTLATLRYIDGEEDSGIPSEVHTFLDEDFDVSLNGNSPSRGMPIIIKENSAEADENGICIQPNLRYTAGTYDLMIGNKTFETIKFMILQNDIYKEYFVDRNARLILMRRHQLQDRILIPRRSPKEYRESIQNSPYVTVNEKKYVLMDERIGEYALSFS